MNPGTYFFQVFGVNKRIKGKISSLPASIAIDMTIFDKSEKAPKLPIGPTIPSPGPTLFKVAAIAVKLVVKSKLSSEIRRTDAAKIKI